jgi:hypothetical protein
MKYDVEYLQKNFEENNDGLTPIAFLKDRTKLYLLNLLEVDQGRNFYKQTGPYWENLYLVLKKYAPEQLAEYERQAGPFDYFNEEVRTEYDFKDDLLNFMAALAYQQERFDSRQIPDEVHYIELGDNEEFVYVPNQSIDQDQYSGREIEEE